MKEMKKSPDERLNVPAVVWSGAVLLFAFSLLLYFWADSPPQSLSGEIYQGSIPDEIPPKTLQAVTSLVAAIQSNPKAPAIPVLDDTLLKEVKRPVYIAIRSEGKVVASEWGEGGSWEENLRNALTEGFSWLPPLHEVDSVEICLTYGYEPSQLSRELELSTGVLGVEMAYDTGFKRVAPVAMLAENRGFQRTVDLFLREQNQDPQSALRKTLHLRTFQAYQVLYHNRPSPRSLQMFRGNSKVPDLITKQDLDSLTNELAAWIVRQVGGDEDGAHPYLIFPGYDDTSNRRNLMARQCLATWALGRLAKLRPTPENKDAFRKNFRHNLLTYFRTDGKTAGLPESNGRFGLGGLALFGLALQEDPSLPNFAFLEKVLNAGILEMWNPETGALRGYKNPVVKDNNQNFYPGEALLYWSVLLESGKNPELLPKFQKSFLYYRKFHRENRNPAFIPWHTQAYYKVWKLTGDPELKDFIFEMNDWLLQMVQWDKAQFDDFRGQFWNPEHPEYGSVPHVSSTSVYLEGLTAALRLARDVGDKKREQAYREAILKGLRSLVLHQFRDEVDMYYVINPSRVRGGLRTTVYNSIIRCDNGAHALMALLRLQKLLKPEDFRLGSE